MNNLRVYAATAVIALTVSVSGTALANHQFSDVGDGSFFGGAIEAIAEAGCATGFEDGTFRPSDSITRGQFAYWLENCGGRAERDYGTATLDTDDEVLDIASDQVLPGTRTGGPGGALGQYVVVIANYDIVTSGTDLPCNVVFTFGVQGGNVSPQDVPSQVVQIQQNTSNLQERAGGTMTMLLPVEAEEIATVTLRATRPAQSGCASTILATGSMLMLSFPFNGVSDGFQG